MKQPQETTLERLARHAAYKDGKRELLACEPEYWTMIVRAILRELREPTEGVLDAGNSEPIRTATGPWITRHEVGRKKWQAMLDHILSEDK